MRQIAWTSADEVALVADDMRLGVVRTLILLQPGVRGAERRLMNCARYLTVLQHPNVLAALDVVSDPRVGHVLVLQHVDAVPLPRFLEDRGRMAPRFAMRLVDGLLGAVAATHAHGIVHRAIDADAILLRKDGTPLLGRFDWASTVNADPLGRPSDITGVGMLLFKLLAGRDAQDLSHAALNPDLAMWRQLPGAAAPVIRRAVHPSTAMRYQTAWEMQIELRAALGKTPQTAPPRRALRM